MTGRHRPVRASLAIGSTALVVVAGCGWQGLNALPLPGAPGRGPGSTVLHVEIANVGSLESNSPVMIDDVIVGSVGTMRAAGWHADVEVFVRPDVAVPANAVASVGQTSLLGSSHLALDPPLGGSPSGRLPSGATIPLNRSSTYPSTEQTLSSLSVVLNAGGLGQIGDIITNFNAALGGRENTFRDLLHRLNTFIGTLNDQRDDIVATIAGMNRLADEFAGHNDVISEVLRELPDALRVLRAQRANLTTALEKLRTFSDTATSLIDDVKTDVVTDLKNLEPTLDALAKVGSPALGKGLQTATVFPFAQYVVDDAIKGDYMNLFATLDLTIPRFKRDLLSGTRFGEKPPPPPPPTPPPPTEPSLPTYTDDPLGAGVAEVPATPAPESPPPLEPSGPGR